MYHLQKALHYSSMLLQQCIPNQQPLPLRRATIADAREHCPCVQGSDTEYVTQNTNNHFLPHRWQSTCWVPPAECFVKPYKCLQVTHHPELEVNHYFFIPIGSKSSNSHSTPCRSIFTRSKKAIYQPSRVQLHCHL